MNPEPMDDYDVVALNKELDRTKSRIFIGKGSASFLAPLMCSMDFVWMPSIKTACTNGRFVGWNPTFFMSLPPETRETVLKHELWHPALLHMIRRGDRDPESWNQACDYRINNDLKAEGCSFKGIEWCCLDPSIDANGRMLEEDIYDQIVAGNIKPPPSPFGGDDGDMVEPSDEDIRAAVNAVIRAVHEHTAAGGAGNVPSIVQVQLDKFLQPVIPWEIELNQFCTDLLESNYSWARPNRRYPDIYLPSLYWDEERLEHLCYYLDVSGSCSNKDVLRFNSEVKYIKEVMKPRKLTLIQFTTDIVHIDEYGEDDPFETVVRHGTGGTSFVDVRRHMMEVRPTAAIIFSDMDCAPMKPLDFEVPTLWVAIRAAGHKPPFGRTIHIRK